MSLPATASDREAVSSDRSGAESGRLLARTRAMVRSWDIGMPVGVWVLTRLLFLGLTYFAVILFHGSGLFQGGHPSLVHQFLPSWGARWDTAWYTEIAQRGYDWKRAAGTSPAAFFPFYPLLIRIVVEGIHRSYPLAALLVSNLACLVALIYLWRLASWELGRSTASRSILYISIFPTAFFLFAGYTEALFLWFTVASFFHLRRGDWIAAGSYGALASATRFTGVLLIVPFLWEYGSSCNWSWRRADWGSLGLVLIPSGLLVFMLYLQLTLGSPLAFTGAQTSWQKTFTWQLWSGIVESLRQIFSVQPVASFFEAHNILNLGIGVLFLVWSVLAARRLPVAYGLYMAAFWVITLASPATAGGYPVPLVSLSRYVLVLFPVFLYAGIIGEKRMYHDSYLVLSAGLLALLTVRFVTGGWVV